MARHVSAENRKRIAKAQKKRWKLWRQQQAAQAAASPVEDVPANGAGSNGLTRVEHSIRLYIQDHEMLLSVDEAKHLRDALSNALPIP